MSHSDVVVQAALGKDEKVLGFLIQSSKHISKKDVTCRVTESSSASLEKKLTWEAIQLYTSNNSRRKKLNALNREEKFKLLTT